MAYALPANWAQRTGHLSGLGPAQRCVMTSGRWGLGSGDERTTMRELGHDLSQPIKDWSALTLAFGHRSAIGAGPASCVE